MQRWEEWLVTNPDGKLPTDQKSEEKEVEEEVEEEEEKEVEKGEEEKILKASGQKQSS
jgi:hypothetical protein